MKTTIIAVFQAVYPFEHVGKEIAQIERDSMVMYWQIQDPNNKVSHFQSATKEMSNKFAKRLLLQYEMDIIFHTTRQRNSVLLVTLRVPSENEQQVCDTTVIAVINGTLQLPYYLSKEQRIASHFFCIGSAIYLIMRSI